MSDYMFMLENHLTADQTFALAEVRNAAQEAGLSIYLTGGAMRDMLGGFPIRDLDFTVEGNPLKMAKALAHKTNATIAVLDEVRKKIDLVFGGGVTVEIAMARQERHLKLGGKLHVTPATIYEDLRGRDFTINALALSLNRASRGLLLDPLNGLGDLQQRELRAGSNNAFYDSPVRLFRLFRFQARLGFVISDRTKSQYENAREAQVENYIPARDLLDELKNIANEPNSLEILTTLEREGLLKLFSPALDATTLNAPALTKLQKARQFLPFGVDLRIDWLGLVLALISEKLSPKDRAALVKHLGMNKQEADSWQKLDARSKKLERQLQSRKLVKPSKVYDAVPRDEGELILHLLVKSSHRLVLDRLKHYLQKYAPSAAEVTDAQVRDVSGLQPGTPKFIKKKAEMIATKLDARPKKVPAPEPEPELPPPSPMGRRAAPSIR